MLIYFSVENFRSIKARQTLYMSAVKTCKEWETENISQEAGLRVLRSAVIYGANASGKTNFLLALERMRLLMLTSVDVDKSVHNLAVELFLLSGELLQSPETFEVKFTCKGKVFTYGFSLRLKGKSPYEYDVVREWLTEEVGRKDQVYFLREQRTTPDGRTENVISVNRVTMPQGEGLETRTRSDALFFTVAAQFAESTCLQISEYFRSSLNISSGVNHAVFNQYTTNQLATNPAFADAIKKIIRDADTGIQDVAVSPNGNLISTHEMYDADGLSRGMVQFTFAIAESQGTQKIFDLSGAIIDTLTGGRILVVDEFDAKLHPMLVRRLMMLFNDPRTNRKNAQLIINVQSPDLLAFKVFYPPRKREILRLRRDQFYFVEKDSFGASQLTSLVEFKNEKGKSVRNDKSVDRDYMMGGYGGVPYVKDLIKMEE